MSQAEAWIVTFLGMGVVFIGLVLCIAFINFFNRLARNITWDGAHGAESASAPAAAQAPEAPRPDPAEPVGPEVLAVISAALEIERRLTQGRPGQRLTIAR